MPPDGRRRDRQAAQPEQEDEGDRPQREADQEPKQHARRGGWNRDGEWYRERAAEDVMRLAAGMVLLALAVSANPEHRDATWLCAVAHAQLPPPPDTEPANPDRPEHRGSVHHGCSRTGKTYEDHAEDEQVAAWHRCACQPKCDKDNPGRRRVPRTCHARCSTQHCHCTPAPCGET